MKQPGRSQSQSRFFARVRNRRSERSCFLVFACTSRNGRNGASRQVFEGRHRSRSRQTSLFDAHRPAGGRRDSRFHHRRQGILGHQRRPQPLLRPSRPGRHSQQPEPHYRQWPRLFVPSDRNQQRAQYGTRPQDFRRTKGRLRRRRQAPGCAATSARVRPKPTRRNSKRCVRRRPSRFAPRKQNRPSELDRFPLELPDETPI